MAKTADGDPARVVELKRELRVMVKAILEDTEDNDSHSSSCLDAIDRATEVLSALKDLNGLSKTTSLRLDDHDGSFSCPPEFRCPLSKKLMRDPVIISTGQVRDRNLFQFDY